MYTMLQGKIYILLMLPTVKLNMAAKECTNDKETINSEIILFELDFRGNYFLGQTKLICWSTALTRPTPF